MQWGRADAQAGVCPTQATLAAAALPAVMSFGCSHTLHTHCILVSPAHALLCVTPSLCQTPRVVDFGAGWYDLDDAFGSARALNAKGMSPAYCSEF